MATIDSLEQRVENQELLRRVMPVEEAVKLVEHRATLAVSGFTKAGEPKVFLPALARHLGEHAPETRIALFSGASLAEEVEGPLAPFIGRRGPYMSSAASRKLILAGKMDFTDVHLSQFARNLMYGFYGDVDIAVVEASRIRNDGGVILTTSVGLSAEALTKAKKIILEVNTAVPDYTGFHDIVLPPAPPRRALADPDHQRARPGRHAVRRDRPAQGGGDRRVAHPGLPGELQADEPDRRQDRRERHRLSARGRRRASGLGDRLPPIQSGVGNVANAIVGELYRSPFQKLRFYTEVFQDGMLRFVEDDEKFDAASATAISLSGPARVDFDRLFKRCRDRLVLRPMWLSNSAEIITRLFVIAMNTPIEVDIYGHVNSTHVDGSQIINGLGGSGDFFRNAYLSIVHTPSVRRLKDGRVVSCVMPYVRHIDHTEHDIKCVVTEQGYAVTTEIRSARNRAVGHHRLLRAPALPAAAARLPQARRRRRRAASDGDERARGLVAGVRRGLPLLPGARMPAAIDPARPAVMKVERAAQERRELGGVG